QQNYGFIETPGRLHVYFHRIVVEDDAFDDLEVGSEVMYSLADDEGPMGPQASRVRLLRGGHAVRGALTAACQRPFEGAQRRRPVMCPASGAPLRRAFGERRGYLNLETATSLAVMNSRSAGWPRSVASMPRRIAGTISAGSVTRSP